MKHLLTAMLIALGCGSPALAKEVQGNGIQGVASVIDGDTIDIRDVRIRLHGVDAPESSQTCKDHSGSFWRCGQQAALALSDKIGRRQIACKQIDMDRYGRVVAECFLGDENLNRWMVREGWAVAYRQYSTEYVAEEGTAQQAAAGIWASEFDMPWDWRKNGQSRETSSGTAVQRLLQVSQSSYSCSPRKTCKAIGSCQEANWYLNNCSWGGKLDGDGDGTPCESLC
jgi:endonuclease YncB( thermonuclease family)